MLLFFSTLLVTLAHKSCCVVQFTIIYLRMHLNLAQEVLSILLEVILFFITNLMAGNFILLENHFYFPFGLSVSHVKPIKSPVAEPSCLFIFYFNDFSPSSIYSCRQSGASLVHN